GDFPELYRQVVAAGRQNGTVRRKRQAGISGRVAGQCPEVLSGGRVREVEHSAISFPGQGGPDARAGNRPCCRVGHNRLFLPRGGIPAADGPVPTNRVKLATVWSEDEA